LAPESRRFPPGVVYAYESGVETRLLRALATIEGSFGNGPDSLTELGSVSKIV